MMRPEFVEAKEYFANNHIKLSDVWLESCLNWLHEELAGTTYTKKDLHIKLYEQWLLLDLREVEVPQLPPNIDQQKKIILNENLILQMMSVIDISKSKLSQLQKIKNSNSLTHGFDEETEGRGLPAKRMLQLTLTDGIQEIKAIEYKIVPNLNVNLTPGIKVKIISPVVIRRGQIMLESHNVTLLGGDVEDILVSHAAENILARALHLPENPRPSTIDESLLDDSIHRNNATVNENYGQNIQQNTINNYINTNQNFTSMERNNAGVLEDLEEIVKAAEIEDMSLEQEMYGNKHRHDEEGIEKEIETLFEAERDIFNDCDIKGVETSSIVSEIKNKPKDVVLVLDDDVINSSLEEDNELLYSFELDKHLDEIEEQYHTSQQLTLKAILDNVQKNKYGKYKTQAKFKSVLKKLTIKNDKWTLQISITDGKDVLPTYVHNDILTAMTGFTPMDTTCLKQQIENKNEDAVHRIMMALKQLKSGLVELDCVMQIEFRNDEESPMIIKLL